METVVKVGGILAEHPMRLKALCNKLGDLSKTHRIVVVPGGGQFADVAREFDRRFLLPSLIGHRMAILGMDQFGLVLSHLIPNSCTVSLLKRAEQLSKTKVTPILLPSKSMFENDSLEPSWDVTSDTIAALIAKRLFFPMVVLATDVDGVFNKNPKDYSDAKLIRNLSAKELLNLGRRTSVDNALPRFLIENQVNCYVVNGNKPERIEAILSNKQTVYTLIKP